MAIAAAAREEGPESIPLEVGEAPYRVELRLRRYPGGDGSRNALLLHGANTSSDTFVEPRGGLTGYLTRNGWQVWLLDWRGSPYVVKRLQGWLGGSPLAEIRHYSVDDVARYDLPAAVEKIRALVGEDAQLSVLGHCVGGGALAIAVATGKLDGLGIEQIVLSTLGLFYEVTWSGWLKAEDFILERVLGNDPGCAGISPRAAEKPDPRAWPWPRDMREAYENFPGAWLPDEHRRGELFRRLGFMIGEPYDPDRLDPTLRGGRTDAIFGPLHLGLYVHVAQMARRGFAAPLDAPDVIDRSRLGRRRALGRPLLDYLEPKPFRGLERTTLLCAAANQVWHRDAMDLMYEWLRNHGAACDKRVFPGYDIQELLWGERAFEAVYPSILASL